MSLHNQTDQKNKQSINYEGICNAAIYYAKDFEKELDYTDLSISALEEILQYYYEDTIKNKPSDQEIWNLSIVFGIYLGQTLLKNGLSEKGYFWFVNEQNIPVLRKNSSNEMYPITKVFKRIKDGSGENVKAFYDLAFMIANKKI